MWPVTTDGGPAGVWDEYWLPTPELPAKTLRPLFDRVWTGGPRRRRGAAGATAPGVDPGGALLARPLAEVFAPPA
jgi:hypothetical protein